MNIINKIIFLSVALVSMVGCASTPGSIKILPGAPMSHTVVGGYPDMLEVYESDRSIFLVAIFGVNRAEKKVSARWDIYDGFGERLYTSPPEDSVIHSNSFITQEVVLTDSLKERLTPENNSASLYIDEKLLLKKSFSYTKRNIINSTVSCAIMLPFIPKNISPFGDPSDRMKNALANTYSSAIYSQVKRVIPDTIPSFVTEERYGKSLTEEVLNDVSVAKKISDENSGCILIGGIFYVGVTSIDLFSLEVYVFNPKSSQWRQFTEGNYVRNDLAMYIEHNLHNVLNQEGFMDHLITLKY